jgi:K+-sensing histidine kinase KdpD
MLLSEPTNAGGSKEMAATIDHNQSSGTARPAIFKISGLSADRHSQSVTKSFDAAGRRRPVIMVCCSGSDRLQDELLARALRDSEAMDANWYVVNVEVPALHFGNSIAASKRIMTRQLRSVASSGAKIVFLKAHDVVRALLDFAWEAGANKIIVGRSRSGILHRLFSPSVTKTLLKRARDVEVEVVGYQRKPNSSAQESRAQKGVPTRSPLNGRGFSKAGMFPVA